METFVIVYLGITSLFFIVTTAVYKTQRDEARRELEYEQAESADDAEDTEYPFSQRIDRIERKSEAHREAMFELGRRFEKMEAQTDHLAKVQMLILQHLSLEHQIQPTKDVLVKLDSKPTKERSA